MTISYVERKNADPTTVSFYDRAEERFSALLNIFKVFGHQPEYGTTFTDTVLAILKDGPLDWKTKELLILKATQANSCKYCVVQHERVSSMLGISEAKIADLEAETYRTSEHFSDSERALLDFAVQITQDANRVSKNLWARLKKHWTESQIVDAAYVIATYIGISKFGDALGVELEPMFNGIDPILEIAH